MNKLSKMIGVIALISATNVMAANDGKDPAPKDLVADLTQMCADWAKDDGIEAAALKKYVLDCVNEELSANGYQTVTDVEIK
ncbi:hypothetical protein ACFOEE_18850 [Pseudoalteromonas fenneropenaei]|uniref:Uncharacterized protein n=1 Tax=Pseudoalteromonas fenneropenaei TaxID=1737459 RepID=A0ABV7CPG0_9GAMM